VSEPIRAPRGLLFDYGGTLVEEVAFDPAAGTDMLLASLTYRPSSLRREAVLDRAERVARELSARRDQFQIEVPWPAVTRLIYDFFGVHFDRPMAELELAFWDASVATRPMPGARDALLALRQRGLPLGVVSNSSFRADVIRHELAKHDLADMLPVIVASAEYGARKPNPLLFETAAALLDVPAQDVWFVGDRLDTDMAGARAAGMVAVWFAPNGVPDAGADLVLRSWADLVRQVEGTAP
jgi:putative hydrolase of the HAD superfamily